MNKPIYALFGLIVFTVVGFFCMLPYISDNDTLLGAVLGVIGALVGAAVGGIFSGWYSYQAGIRGAKENYKLSIDKQNYISQKALLLQISYSEEKINNVQHYISDPKNKEQLIPYNLESLIYNKDWYKDLALVDDLSKEEKDNIIIWFTWLTDIQYLAKLNGGYLKKELAKEILSKNAMNFEEINEIRIKLSNL